MGRGAGGGPSWEAEERLGWRQVWWTTSAQEADPSGRVQQALVVQVPDHRRRVRRHRCWATGALGTPGDEEGALGDLEGAPGGGDSEGAPGGGDSEGAPGGRDSEGTLGPLGGDEGILGEGSGGT